MRGLLHVKRLLCPCTTCELEADYAYEYMFERKAAYCVRKKLVHSKRLMRTNTHFRVNRAFLYVYDLGA